MHTLWKRKHSKNGPTTNNKNPKMQMQHMQKNLPNHLQKHWHHTPNQTTNNKNVSKRQRNTRHRTRPKHQHKHGYVSFKKTQKLQTNTNPKYTNHSQPLKARLEMDEMWGRVYCKKTPCWL